MKSRGFSGGKRFPPGDSGGVPRGDPFYQTPLATNHAALLMRCFYRQLSIERVLKPTRSSRTEAEFARKHAAKFCDRLKRSGATSSDGSLHTARALPVLRDWLSEMSTNGRGREFGPVPDGERRRGQNRFDWDGWFLASRQELETLTAKAMLHCARGLSADA